MATPLTPRGERTARALAGTSYALVVSSPLERAKRTAELIGG
ncbi:MAG TPA: histidine phosphatase family protein, partial [Candidatus Limnocylindria bacterium]